MKTLLFTLTLMLSLSVSAVTIDGLNITGDFANATWKVYQNIADDWGGNNCIAMYVETNDTHLLVGIPGFVNNNAIGFFIDANTELGTNVMPGGLTMSDSICAGMAGLTFDTAFAPEMAVALRTADQSGNDDAWPAIENIVADGRTYLGTLDDIRLLGSVVTNGDTILGAFMSLAPTLSETNTFPEGLEFQIAYADLQNNTSAVKVLAMVCGNDGGWANNQILPPAGPDTNTWTSSPSADHDATQVPGDQFTTITIPALDTNVNAIATKNKSLVFAETDIEFTSAVSGGTPPYTFDWDLGNGVHTNVQDFVYAYPNAGDYTATLTVNDSGALSDNVDLGNTKVYAATTVDGTDIPVDFAGKGTNVFQDTTSEWAGPCLAPGDGAKIDKLYAYCEGRSLYIGVCSRLTTNTADRVLGIFIDSDYATGTNVMPLIDIGSPAKLQNLENMTFDADFTPDKAILASVGSPGDFWVNIYHINLNSEWYWDSKTEYTSIFDPFQRVVNDRDGLAGDIIALNDSSTEPMLADSKDGLECKLDFDTIYEGITPGPGQDTVRIQAILYNWNTTNIANQSLPGINDDPNGYGVASNVNYEAVSGLQYIEVCAPIPEPFFAFIPVALVILLRKLR